MPFATIQQQVTVAKASVAELGKCYEEGLLCAIEYSQKLLEISIELLDSAVGSKCDSCHDPEACAEAGCQCITEKQ